MKYRYNTKGTCSSAIEFDLDDDIITNIKFKGGCMGNTQGVAALADGMSAEEVVRLCKGIKCGFKGTSCPDQLAKAIEKAMNNEIDALEV